MTIALTGASGQLGQLALTAIKARDPAASVIALARDPAKISDTEARAFDYTKPETLAAGLQGVSTVVLISSNDFNDRDGQHRAVIDAARAAGVSRIIYTSILKGAASPMLLAADHIATEAYLQTSGLVTTLLRNGWYTENYTGTLAMSVQHGAIIGASGEGRISMAARADYAEAIAVTALDAAHSGKTYELAGDTAHSMADFAAEVSKAAGKAVGFVDMPQADFAAALKGFGLPEGFAMVLADVDAHVQNGALEDHSHSLSRLIGRPTTPIGQTITAAL